MYNSIVFQSIDWFGGSCCWVVLTQLILKSTMFAANTDLSGTVPMYADFGLLLLHEFLHTGTLNLHTLEQICILHLLLSKENPGSCPTHVHYSVEI